MILAVTIKEIAKMTGVSITTISQILNNKGERFSAATREKVLDAVKKLSYEPDFFAKNMIIRKTNNIGMIIPKVTDPFFSQIVHGVENTLNEQGYLLLLCNSDNDRQREQVYVEKLIHQSVDGFIIASPNILDTQIFKMMKDSRKAFVLIDRTLNKRNEGNIFVDDFYGGYLATEHLIQLGHRRIGMMTSDDSFYNLIERLQGYKKCMNDYQCPVEDDWIVENTLTLQGGYDAAKDLLAKSLTAIVCGNDQMAIGAYRAAREAGVRIPADLSIIGYDDIEISRYVVPPLTTVSQPIYEIGETAAALLLNKIAHPEERIKNKTLKVELKVRESTRHLDRH